MSEILGAHHNREYKRSCHDASIRVPTALAGGGLRGRVPQLVSHIDLPPTLLDGTGLPVPPEMQGRSILPFLDGHTTGPDDVLIQISESETGRALRSQRWKYGVSAPESDPWDSPSATAYVGTYLYDLETDPSELTNLVHDPRLTDLRRQLRTRLLGRIVKSGEEKPVIAVPA